jgi:DegV family protein with EDD domain
MGRVRVVTDGAADVPGPVAEQSGIEVIRGPIHFGEASFTGGADEFWCALRDAEAPPSTSPPSADVLAAAFGGDEPVCAVHVSGELSTTVEHAKAAAAGSARVHVVDSRSISVGTALVALAVAEGVGDGDGDLDQLKARARRLVDRVHLYALIDDPGYLLRGGRAGLIEGLPARRHERLVVAVKGHVIPLGHERDRRRGIRELLSHLRRAASHGTACWALGHGDASDAADVAADVEGILGSRPRFVVRLGPAVGTHAGPDALLVGFLDPG